MNGVSDTEFGVGTNISRQDMSVMIIRTLESLAVDFATKNASAFADDNAISDYAAKSVYAMRSIGLIDGYNNEFRPKDNLTRAEAAKVISNLLDFVKVN